ncbi:MAG: lytic transglycosylase [Rhodospirillales bacterium 20-64-7]|nr:MAG: lytic transglycosylase [Rhodospirillales bacterium 20-64-7]
MIPYLHCMLVVAATAALPPRVLPVIQKIEGGAVGVVHQNGNGSQDLGVMQVNTLWLPVLAARAGISERETRRRLTEDACFNIAAAALILREYLSQEDGALLPAIGDYHSHTPALNRAYAELATATAWKLFSAK